MSLRVDKLEEINLTGKLDLFKVHEVMVSNLISQEQKTRFIKKNYSAISELIDERISSGDFKLMMKNRPLIIYSPLKNSYTKVGDKKLLSIVLKISPRNVDDYIKTMTSEVRSNQDLNKIGLSKDKYEKVKTYVFRHGTKEQVADYFDYELAHSKNIFSMVYHILQYNAGGVADYFSRPIHRLDNKTLIKLYNTVNKNLKARMETGKLTEVEAREIADWALTRLYKIQNNQFVKVN